MPKPLLTTLAAAVAALAAQAAQANGFYVSGAIDGVFRQSTTSAINAATDPFDNSATNANGQRIPYREQEHYNYKAGGEANVAGGYRFGLGRWGALRVEGEFSFRDYRLGASTVQSLPNQIFGTRYRSSIDTVKGDYLQRYGETANAFYDLPSFAFVTPYVGAGVGYAESVQTPGQRIHEYQETQSPTGFIFGPVATAGGSYLQEIKGATSDDGTWLVEGGLSLKMTPHLDLVPAYRYSQAFAGHTAVNLLKIGLRYSF